MVVNAPTSNIISAAELAIGHLLSLARHIPDANASLKQDKWERNKFTGVELYDKTISKDSTKLLRSRSRRSIFKELRFV
jgi:D-3-phosphoglycerate dehydrogenase